MNPKEVELLMGGGDGQGGIFTWRERHRRKVCLIHFLGPRIIFLPPLAVGLFCVSRMAVRHDCHADADLTQLWNQFLQ